MQSHYLPPSVCDHLNRIARSFIWGGDGVSQGWSLINWKTVTSRKQFGGLGVRDARLTNVALLGKLVWSLMHESQKLWVQILGHKYLGYNYIWSARAKSGSSITWRSITKAMTELKEGYWLLNQLSPPVNSTLLNQIQSYTPPVCFNAAMVDKWIWSGSRNGVYTCAPAYRWLLSRQREWDLAANWNWVWKIGAPAKIQHFMWLCLHDAIPTNHKRHRCNLSSSPACIRCSCADEDALHCLRDCPHSREVWLRVGLLAYPDFLNHTEVSSWVHDMARRKMYILFVTTLWWVWVWRNQMVFNDVQLEVNVAVRRILAFHDEHISCYPSKTTSNLADRFLARWNPPLEGKIKMNSDGSAILSSGAIGSGGLFRNHRGNWLRGFVSNDGMGDPLLAELSGILHGVSIAIDLGFTDMVCETDCLKAVSLLQNKDQYRFHLHASIPAAIVNILEGDVIFSITHSVRETNKCADYLAREGVHSSDRRKFLASPPVGLGALLLSDYLSI